MNIIVFGMGRADEIIRNIMRLKREQELQGLVEMHKATGKCLIFSEIDEIIKIKRDET